MNGLDKYTDPVLLRRLGNMELAARFAVEGFFSGSHRSPYHGFSVEYSDHRDYRPGDDLRYVDWKAYARSDRLYVKQFQQETNTTVHILLDVSGSMAFGSGQLSKADYGSLLGAALSYIALKQNDRVSLMTFAGSVGKKIPASSKRTQLNLILKALSDIKPGGETGFGDAVSDFSRMQTRRGLVVIISDMPGLDQQARKSLVRLRHHKHDVICFVLLDSQELDFDYTGMINFRDIETGGTLKVNADSARKRYRKQVNGFIGDLKNFCGHNEIDLCLLNTSHRLDEGLCAYLDRRKKMY